MKNKKGITTANTILIMFYLFVIVILLGIGGLIFYYINYYLDASNVIIGQTNLSQVNAVTFGQIANAYLDKMDYLGYFIIAALVLGMGLNAYLLRNRFPLVFLLIDILLLIVAYIIAVEISNAYELMINSHEIMGIYTERMPKTSVFMLNLPIYSSVIGIFMLILTYIPYPRSANEQITTSAQELNIEGVA